MNLENGEEDEEIKIIENENNLLDEAGYYSVENENTEKGLLNWEENFSTQDSNLQNPQNSLVFSQMNSVNPHKVLDPKIIATFKMVGDILAHYTSGKLPKAFNVITTTENWEELLELTKPENWTSHAMYEATVMFSSGEIFMACEFYEKVLVPAIKKDIKQHNRLNIHYYDCLKRALFKPGAFFKGIILPMSKCLTLKEAPIVGSILRKCSIPNNHASAAIVKLTQFCKEGKNGVSFGALFFLKILIMKKFAIPSEVKDILVKFFLEYSSYNSTHKIILPVLWHQVFLCFIQHYKLDLDQNQKKSLKELNGKIGHKDIAEEIYKELNYIPN